VTNNAAPSGSDHKVPKALGHPAQLDAESAEWLQALAGTGPHREAALARLHERLLRIARREAARRGPQLAISGPELDDVAHQAAADALLAITAKLGQFRGESRFTTWAYRFVIFEVSAKIGRHFWRHPVVSLGAEDWDRLPARFGFDPAHQAEWRDLLTALRQAVDTELTRDSARCSSRSCSTTFRWIRWLCRQLPAAMRSTRCCSTPGVSFGPRWLLTGICPMTFRGGHERLVGTGPVLAD
jgi:DNA-directed RNA polymerase specialized sigma24 family protein